MVVNNQRVAWSTDATTANQTILPRKPKTRYRVNGFYVMCANTAGTNSSGVSLGLDIDGSEQYIASVGISPATADRNQEVVTGLDLVGDWGGAVYCHNVAPASLLFVCLYYSEEYMP